MIKTLYVFMFIFLGTSLMAQEFGYGFKAGLNSNSFKGPSETDANGNELEEFTSNGGFHVGAIVTWKATDLMGLRGEFIFIQKGGRRSFDGPSYLNLTSTAGDVVATTGNRKQNINITTSYIDIPVTGYFKPVEWLEIYGGVNVSFLVSASVFGELTYSNGKMVVNGAGTDPDPFSYEIDGNYISGDPGEAVFANPPKIVRVGTSTLVEIPSSAGVYYEFDEDRGNLYKAIDFGALAGISVYLNRGLFVSARINYSLTDVTKQNADVSLVSRDNGKFITRDDDDRNFSLQASIGFSF